MVASGKWRRQGVLALLFCLGFTVSSDAGQFTSARVSVTDSMPLVRPDWPIPAEPGQLFYIQRSTNSNTVVYTARYREDRTLDPADPVRVYWRRYNTTGARKALKFIEKQFAFGINFRQGNEPGQFTITVKPLPELPMQLRQTSSGKAEIFAHIGGRLVRPVYAFITVDEGSILSRVTGFSLHGFDVATGKAITETFRVTGGEFRQ